MAGRSLRIASFLTLAWHVRTQSCTNRSENIGETIGVFLQIDAEKHHAQVNASTMQGKPLMPEGIAEGPHSLDEKAAMGDEVAERLLKVFGMISKYLVCSSYVLVVMMLSYLCVWGLPSKMSQDPSVRAEGCPRSWVLYLGVVYMVIWASTDQYVPSLPTMERDLSGSEASMTATVQINWMVKAVFGLLAAGISDRIGRRPVALLCRVLLCISTFCCACAQHVDYFIAARILQGMGESFQPVVYAMIRDYFSDLNERIRVSAFLQIMALIGGCVAPFYGGLCEEFLGWRSSFFGISLVWAGLAFVGSVHMVESCPDHTESYFKDLSRLWDGRLACLLLTESSVSAVDYIFNANCSYLMEGIFHRSVMASATVMLVYGVLCSGGAVLFDRLHLDVLTAARISLSIFAAFGGISIALGLAFHDYLWAYLLGTFLQSFVLCMSLVSAQVLFCEPLADCAGMAASMEALAQNLVPSLVSLLATKALISDGARGLALWQAAPCLAAAAVFWLGCGYRPPEWAMTSEAKETDKLKGK